MNPLQHIFLLLIKGYQWAVSPVLSALFGDQCRFQPSCSRYAAEAICTHGAVRGCWLAGWRVLRCNPWSGCCGPDPVPQVRLHL
ncbi:MAG: membrane protein insertion efficiency factor YidD [Verrucomicrobiia bacterium]|jgi:putative membrane protein insertion efficiency factor